MNIGIRYAARSDVGMLREGNEDSAYAGTRLLAVADGMGGHVGGEIASAAAIDALRKLDADVPAAELLAALEHAVKQANENLHRIVEGDPTLQGMGTTLTAMLWSGSQIALVHIGDSRAYLLRNGELFQITHDHTLVQSLVDEGRISIDEAAVHPQRSLLLRALDGRGEVDPDLSLREARVGDRYLLCSDGLSGVVSAETIHQVLTGVADPEQAVRQLIDLANRGGGPDNITCVVADVADLSQQLPAVRPVVAGAAANSGGPPGQTSGGPAPAMVEDTPAQRARQLGDTMPQPPIAVDEMPPPAPAPAMAGAGDPMRRSPHARPRRSWTWLVVAVVVFALLIVGGGFAGLRLLRSGYYVTADKGTVAIYKGSPDGVFGLDMSQKAKDQPSPPVPLSDLPPDRRKQVTDTIQVDGGLTAAKNTVNELRAALCRYTVASEKENVLIFQGRGQVDKGCSGASITGTPALKINDLPNSDKEAVRKGIASESREGAQATLTELIAKRDTCRTTPTALPDCPK
ncbi:PP2C family protein-serine/threonine phosphatase [Actinomadura sp. HBU206391]|uniref:PP2C family protein-serine/threonine phosphatase n=1 Tax=Actinomadura sp. HBU206391 TaxID=2731692 RepID=UPI00164F3673|nr:PP2C family serine/threonine-protein phosphatase [Actinomadura sp. HBU206391]MBC6457164.1 serine/threonine-protein phosphatase [Actinomadura sp. HBU206391]